MISYNAYKLVHLIGLFMLFTSFGALSLNTFAGSPKQFKGRGLVGTIHGASLFMVLLGGFGMLAQLKVTGLPYWVWAKLTIWTALGLSSLLFKRKPLWVYFSLAWVFSLSAIAVAIVLYK